MNRMLLVQGVLLILLTSNSISARAQSSDPTGSGAPPAITTVVNPEKVALLKWFPAYETTSFAVGKSPTGVAFDGANIWVTNQYGSSVTKVRANDGTNLGTFTTGSGPTGIAFDEANM